MPSYADPNNPSGLGNFDPNNLLGRNYLNFDPDAGWWHYLANQGLSANDPVSRYARQQFDRTQGLYKSVAADDPNMGFLDYLERYNPRFDQEFASLSPEQRGDTGGLRNAPRARFIRAY